MDDHALLAEQFEQTRTHLRTVAYRMLGSMPAADDAVQESWLRLSRAGAGGVENLGGWLTTVVARGVPGHVALAQVKARGTARRGGARADREPRRRGRP